MSTPLSQEQISQFENDGYLIAYGLLDRARDLQLVIDEYHELPDHLVDRWQAAGLLHRTYDELGFGKRLLAIVKQTKQRYDGMFDISLPQNSVDHDTPIHAGPAVFNLLRTPILLDAVEQFISPEIFSNPVQHTRVKLPESAMPSEVETGLTAQIDWHQDLGAITADTDDANILTVWFPITDAQLDNGCLAVTPRSHKHGRVTHCKSNNPLTMGQMSIPQPLQKPNKIELPMMPGDALFLHKCTHHAGLPNYSDRIRWSFDLRYPPVGNPTGRSAFPGFVARSTKKPQTALTDSAVWSQTWRNARSALTRANNPLYNRRTGKSLYCA